MSGNTPRTHKFHAQSHILAGRLNLPLDREIQHQEQATLPEKGGYLSQHSVRYNVEGVISFERAYTQVAGHKDVKPGHGWTTVATSVIEQLNILEVVTADRVVGQISTEHPEEGYVPIVTFLGTRFDNLRIAGHPVRVEMDPFILGPKPDNDAGYRSHSPFQQRVAAQYERLRGFRDVPAEITGRYNRVPTTVEEPLECSLVTHTEGFFPGRCFGHVLDIPHFGKVYLAVLKIEESEHHPELKNPKQTLISLTMVEAQMGCLAHGSVKASSLVTNGTTVP